MCDFGGGSKIEIQFKFNGCWLSKANRMKEVSEKNENACNILCFDLNNSYQNNRFDKMSRQSRSVVRFFVSF